MSSERDRQRAAHLELVARWADDLAHEIKNPLHAMVINLELVKRRAGGGDPGAIVERAEIVESELHRVHDLVDSLLRLVRPWPDNPAAAVHEVFAMLLPVFSARARVRKVTYVHDAEEAGVAMSPGDLAQLLVVLVDRAIDATPEGGAITTGVSVRDAAVRIAVAHAPPGSDADSIPGSGAGEAHDLEAHRRLVEAHGGSLETEGDGPGGRAVLVLPQRGSA